MCRRRGRSSPDATEAAAIRASQTAADSAGRAATGPRAEAPARAARPRVIPSCGHESRASPEFWSARGATDRGPLRPCTMVRRGQFSLASAPVHAIALGRLVNRALGIVAAYNT